MATAAADELLMKQQLANDFWLIATAESAGKV